MNASLPVSRYATMSDTDFQLCAYLDPDFEDQVTIADYIRLCRLHTSSSPKECHRIPPLPESLARHTRGVIVYNPTCGDQNMLPLLAIALEALTVGTRLGLSLLARRPGVVLSVALSVSIRRGIARVAGVAAALWRRRQLIGRDPEQHLTPSGVTVSMRVMKALARVNQALDNLIRLSGGKLATIYITIVVVTLITRWLERRVSTPHATLSPTQQQHVADLSHDLRREVPDGNALVAELDLLSSVLQACGSTPEGVAALHESPDAFADYILSATTTDVPFCERLK